MLTTYFRSSSISTYLQCQLKYYLEYILNFRYPAHISAWKGNIVHKGIELLAKRRLAEQSNMPEFEEDGKIYKVSELTIDAAIEEAIRIYIEKEPERQYLDTDIYDVKDWYRKHLEEYKEWSPLEREVVSTEDYFDIYFDEPWADFEFNIKGKNIKGKIAMKGAMDLLYKVDDDTYEYCDIKTGKRRDFNTGITKDFDKLREDTQLLMYYYALRNKYPDKHIIMTILYLNHGGAYTIPFDDHSLIKIKDRIRGYYEEIKKIIKPNNIKGDYKCNFCPFKKEIYKNDISYCDWFDMEIQKVGVDLVTNKYLMSLPIYGHGGGTERK